MLAEAPADVCPMPPMRQTQRQTCRNHRPFDSEGEAWAHYVAQLVANVTDPGQTVYRCACGSWHHGGGIRSLGRLLTNAGWKDEVQDG